MVHAEWDVHDESTCQQRRLNVAGDAGYASLRGIRGSKTCDGCSQLKASTLRSPGSKADIVARSLMPALTAATDHLTQRRRYWHRPWLDPRVCSDRLEAQRSHLCGSVPAALRLSARPLPTPPHRGAPDTPTSSTAHPAPPAVPGLMRWTPVAAAVGALALLVAAVARVRSRPTTAVAVVLTCLVSNAAAAAPPLPLATTATAGTSPPDPNVNDTIVSSATALQLAIQNGRLSGAPVSLGCR